MFAFVVIGWGFIYLFILSIKEQDIYTGFPNYVKPNIYRSSIYMKPDHRLWGTSSTLIEKCSGFFNVTWIELTEIRPAIMLGLSDTC